MQVPATVAAIQMQIVACHHDKPLSTKLEPSVLRALQVCRLPCSKYVSGIRDVPVTKAHSEPEDAEVVPPPVDLCRRRRLQVLIDPRVRLMRVAFRVDIGKEGLLGVERVPEAVCPSAYRGEDLNVEPLDLEGAGTEGKNKAYGEHKGSCTGGCEEPSLYTPPAG
ncbi:hypothetical protein DAEQUDRAFT_540197 [Daedalea quercina L-15889]|uniref:Uncharacterized protein n=1 Tax=Daedalea quercina L-15889 TaxID=1314783 RepID=A0A165M3M0_9APHY|nr:hypothetical protein DAEQUDRAFT_540197 [Daedalea quercina L-15889]